MNARCASFKDYENLKELWREAFTEEDGFMEAFFRERASDPSNILLLEQKDTGALVSMLFLLPGTLEKAEPASQRQTLSAVNIVGVATFAKFRKKGYMTRLLEYCFRVLRERGVEVAVLKPSSKAFYAQYGFEVCNLLYECEWPITSDSEVYHTVTPALIERLDQMYQTAPSAGYRLRRTFADWKFLLRDYTVVIKDGAYGLCHRIDEKMVAFEVVPAVTGKGRETGCTMYKVLCDKDIHMEPGQGNLIFEQY